MLFYVRQDFMVILFFKKKSKVNSLLADGCEFSQTYVMLSALIFALIFENLFRFVWSNEFDNVTNFNLSETNSTNNLTFATNSSRPTKIRLSSRFSEYDIDKNGQITLEELSKVTKTQLTNAEGPFTAADTNGDKVLTENEFLEAPWLFMTRKKVKHSHRRLSNNSTINEKKNRKVNRKKIKQILRKERNKKKKKRTTVRKAKKEQTNLD